MVDPISAIAGAVIIGGVGKLMGRFVTNNPPKETDGWVIRSARWTAIQLLPSIKAPAKSLEKDAQDAVKDETKGWLRRALKKVAGK
jgi:hypothetical protein